MKAYLVKLDCQDDEIIVLANSAEEASLKATKWARKENGDTYPGMETEREYDCESIKLIADEGIN